MSAQQQLMDYRGGAVFRRNVLKQIVAGFTLIAGAKEYEVLVQRTAADADGSAFEVRQIRCGALGCHHQPAYGEREWYEEQLLPLRALRGSPDEIGEDYVDRSAEERHLTRAAVRKRPDRSTNPVLFE
jgi:hypothetical protein